MRSRRPRLGQTARQVRLANLRRPADLEPSLEREGIVTGDPSEYSLGGPAVVIDGMPLQRPKRSEVEVLSDEIAAARADLERAHQRLETLGGRLEALRRHATP
jgi:hypothetical protein